VRAPPRPPDSRVSSLIFSSRYRIGVGQLSRGKQVERHIALCHALVHQGEDMGERSSSLKLALSPVTPGMSSKGFGNWRSTSRCVDQSSREISSRGPDCR